MNNAGEPPNWNEIEKLVTMAVEKVPTLTARQREVLMALSDGPTDRILARRLGVSIFTARDHFRVVKRQLGVDNRIVVGIVGYLVLRDSQRCELPR